MKPKKLKINYYVNDDKKCVTCQIKVDENEQRYSQELNDFTTICLFKYRDFLKFEFYGIARYKDGDTFDLEKAKRIALLKARRQMYGHFEWLTGKIYDELTETLFQQHNEMVDLNRRTLKITDEILCIKDS